MTAKAAGFSSRAEAGLVVPRAISHDVDPSKGGVAVHYGGAPSSIIQSHTTCLARWRSWQAFHMRPGGLGVPSGGSDIAYNFGVCPHGYVLAGRGLGVRSGANGTSESNAAWYAVVWMNDRATPNQEALDAIEWLILNCRNHGATDRVQPHRRFHQTDCPGDPMAQIVAQRWDGKTVSTGGDSGGGGKKPLPPNYPLPEGYYYGPRSGPKQSVSGMAPGTRPAWVAGLRTWQGRMKTRGWKIAADGQFGAQTEGVVRSFQAEKHVREEYGAGKIGRSTWAAAWTAPIS